MNTISLDGFTTVSVQQVIHDDDDSNDTGRLIFQQPAHIKIVQHDSAVWVPAQSLEINNYHALKELYLLLKDRFEKS